MRDLLEARDALYRPFDLHKKKHPYPGKLRLAEATRKPAKLRRIDNPAKQLKEIQSKILRRILSNVEFPDYMFGAVRGRSLVLHANLHVRNQASTVVHMDISSFYPSVTCHQIYWVWNTVLNCPPPVAKLLTELTTFKWCLPQGAPTSSALANIYLASIYGPVCLTCEAKSITISTWVDDLVFSGSRAREVMENVRAVLAKSGLRLAEEKREILGSRSEKIVTGVRLGSRGPRAPHRVMKDLRSAIHRLATGLVSPEEEVRYRNNLIGRIRHIRHICVSDAHKLMLLAEMKGLRLQQ